MRDWLVVARTHSGLTMRQMAEKLDISESYYSLIESGDRQKRMDLALVSRLSAALGMSINEIAELEGW